MKKIFLIAAIFTISKYSISQNNTGVHDDLSGIVLHNANVNTTAISTFNNNEIKGSRYLFNKWTPGSVLDENNITYSANYTFNFDKINHDLYAKYGGENGVSVLIDKSKIKQFSISSHNFINSSLINPSLKEKFFEVLVADTNKVSLYKLTTTTFVKADMTDMMKVKTGNFSNEYVDDIKYFVSIKHNSLKKINFNENQIRKSLKDYNDKIDLFFNLNSKEIDEALLTELIKYLNQ